MIIQFSFEKYITWVSVCLLSTMPSAIEMDSKQLVATPKQQTETEEMFSGLGLDSFMTGQGVSTASKSSPIVNGSTGKTTNASSSLSMEDKQR